MTTGLLEITSYIWGEIGWGILETLGMTVISTIIAHVIGIPLGVLLAVTDKGGLKPCIWLNKIVGVIVNILRSIPFLILLVLVMPFTRAILGTALGWQSVTVPLTIAAAPFIARLTETSLKEVDSGLIEASLACGASPFKTMWKTLLPEAVPSLISNAAVALVTIIGYSAMAGFCGGGGLGTIALTYGYYRNNTTVMIVTVVFIVVIVQVFQELGLWLAKKRDRRSKGMAK
ncbi:MAG: ABC transporter permease [Clostridia bacterium]|nr:ABC transporter permease [Clostridia bacterium]